MAVSTGGGENAVPFNRHMALKLATKPMAEDSTYPSTPTT